MYMICMHKSIHGKVVVPSNAFLDVQVNVLEIVTSLWPLMPSVDQMVGRSVCHKFLKGQEAYTPIGLLVCIICNV